MRPFVFFSAIGLLARSRCVKGGRRDTQYMHRPGATPDWTLPSGRFFRRSAFTSYNWR